MQNKNYYAIDSHCHLDLLASQDIDIEEVIKNAKKNNVGLLQTICTEFCNLENLIKYSEKYDIVYNSVGLHPCNVRFDNILSYDEIVKLCNHPKTIGIGETGLDFYHQNNNYDLQEQSFINHIKASQQTKLPVIIHSRNSDDKMVEILTKYQKQQEFPALIHCFSSNIDIAKIFIAMNIYISISGIVTFKNAADIHEAVRYIPLEYILIETDSPYLAPSPHRGKINKPEMVVEVAKMIASLKNISYQEVVNYSSKNFYQLFKKAEIKNKYFE
jgi:TatD DNase family protein